MIFDRATAGQVRISRVIFAIFFAAMLVAAVIVHVKTALPSAYSWARTLELFRDALLDSYFIVFSLIAVLAGISSRGKGVLWSWMKTSFCRPSKLALGVAAAGLIASEVFYFSHAYTLADQFLLPVFLFFLVCMLEDRRFLPVGLSVALGIGGLVTVSYVFTIVKSQLFVVTEPRDSLIVMVESLLFGQPFYQTVAAWAAKNPWAVSLSDWVYFLFFHHIALVALFLFSRADRLEETRYFVTLVACYLIGSLSYFLLPTLGPVFYDPERFSYIRKVVSFTPMIQDLLQHSTESVASGQLKTISTYAFIAGMPSLHMAHETVMLYFSRKSRAMFLLSLMFWMLSFSAVLVLGWHYLFEALAGLVLAAIVLPAALLVSGPVSEEQHGSVPK